VRKYTAGIAGSTGGESERLECSRSQFNNPQSAIRNYNFIEEDTLKRHCIIAALGIVALIGAVPVGAQQNSGKAKDSPIVTQDVNPRLKSQVSMRAQDANLSEILRVLSEKSGMNFVTGEGVYKEKITIILTSTPVDEAIDLVVRAAGLAYEIIGNSVLIGEPDKLKGEVGQQGYVIALKYANADEVAVMLADLTKNIKVDQAGNRLICFTSPRVINEIERIVKSIDHPHILVQLETRLIEVQVNSDKKFGVDWARLTPITSGLLHPDYNLGNNWTLLSPTTGAGGGGGGGTGSAVSSGGGVSGINIALDMMINSGNARLLMDSKLTTTNNRPASLHIGEVTPYEVQSYNMSGSGGGANIQVQKEETGIKVNMLPHVNENNQVTITVEPEVSNIVGFLGQNKDLPQTQVRKTSTTVRVKDGHTVFIAGLLREDNTVAVSKVPVLGDIPLIGLLFQNKRDKKVKTNLVLEITPRILHDSTDARASDDVKQSETREAAAPAAPSSEPQAIAPAPAQRQVQAAPATQPQAQAQPAVAAPAAKPAAAPAATGNRAAQ
jgi:type II secretory pathway component GspD/PulD (secretin)